MYKERPEFLAYHEKSYHLLDIKPCQCSQIGFGSVDEILCKTSYQLQNCHGSTIKFDSKIMDDEFKMEPFCVEQLVESSQTTIGEEKDVNSIVDAEPAPELKCKNFIPASSDFVKDSFVSKGSYCLYDPERFLLR